MNDIKHKLFTNHSENNTNSASNRLFYKNIYKEGIYYGYPKCCINSYIANHYNDESFTHIQLCVSAGTGFIPCQQHAFALISQNIDISLIIRNRQCRFDFPMDDE